MTIQRQLETLSGVVDSNGRLLYELMVKLSDQHGAIAVLQALLQVVDARLTKVETALAYQGKAVKNEVTPEYGETELE